jgi:hypothetical protein
LLEDPGEDRFVFGQDRGVGGMLSTRSVVGRLHEPKRLPFLLCPRFLLFPAGTFGAAVMVSNGGNQHRLVVLVFRVSARQARLRFVRTGSIFVFLLG